LQVKQPILFLSGLQDELVPPSHMKMLYDKAVEHNRNCRFIDFPSGMHMDTWMSGGDRYWRAIQLFLDQYAPEVQSRDASFKSETAEDGNLLPYLFETFVKVYPILIFAFEMGLVYFRSALTAMDFPG